ncbi:YraN family protein [candidate division WOR-3 bacterium]|nr:YraN family protein [candidate division WOR-3 bacterium]
MPQKTEKAKTGAFGENIAVEYLKKKGYNVKCRNVRVGKAEIDIVASFKGLAVFVEVKTRSDESWDSDLESWSVGQRKIFLKAIKSYLAKNKMWGNTDVRLDLICVNSETGELTHLENALTDTPWR